MRPVDYDRRIYAAYQEGAALAPPVVATWLAAFGRRLPARRPLRLADVGSGTGRFTPALADEFGGPVFGVEPSDRMREIALETALAPNVSYTKGRGEQLPLGDDSVDAAVLFGVWHHIEDRPAAAAELARVVRAGGTLLLRTSSSDRLAEPWWHPQFPEVRQADVAILPTLATTTQTLTSAGWHLAAIDRVPISSGLTRREELARLETRVLSTFEHLSETEIERGLERIRASLDGAADQPAPTTPNDLLVFRSNATSPG
jgi:ubiquinone/menaquinone biosynthesis C-methylase UbiE